MPQALATNDERLAKRRFTGRRPRFYGEERKTKITKKNAILRPANFVLPTIYIIFAANSGFYNHFAK